MTSVPRACCGLWWLWNGGRVTEARHSKRTHGNRHQALGMRCCRRCARAGQDCAMDPRLGRRDLTPRSRSSALADCGCGGERTVRLHCQTWAGLPGSRDRVFRMRLAASRRNPPAKKYSIFRPAFEDSPSPPVKAPQPPCTPRGSLARASTQQSCHSHRLTHWAQQSGRPALRLAAAGRRIAASKYSRRFFSGGLTKSE